MPGLIMKKYLKQVRLSSFLVLATILISSGCQQEESGDDTLLLVALAAGASQQTATNTIVYGRDTCGATSSLRANLDNADIPFTYKNVDEPAVSQEMWDKVSQASWYNSGDTVGIPIVDVNGTVLQSPTLEEVQNLL